MLCVPVVHHRQHQHAKQRVYMPATKRLQFYFLLWTKRNTQKYEMLNEREKPKSRPTHVHNGRGLVLRRFNIQRNKFQNTKKTHESERTEVNCMWRTRSALRCVSFNRFSFHFGFLCVSVGWYRTVDVHTNKQEMKSNNRAEHWKHKKWIHMN